MTLAYAVSQGEYSDYRVLCVCPSKEDAEELAARAGGKVEEFLVCRGDEAVVQEVLVIESAIFDDGSESRHWEQLRKIWPWDELQTHAALEWSWHRTEYLKSSPPGTAGGVLQATGTDHERVRRVFSDQRARLLADVAYRLQDDVRGGR